MKITPIEVTYRNHLGTDLDVVNAARVSFAKESEWELVNPRAIDELGKPIAEHSDLVLSEKDEKLIKYLAEHNHWSPFSHCFVSFHVKAPIFIARQLQKHTVGLAWNEVSRRYVDEEPEFYFPDVWRKRADNVKQGSSDEPAYMMADLSGNDWLVNDVIKDFVQDSLYVYLSAVKAGVAPEQARMILPQNTMTEWIWSGSLYAFARVVNLRLGAGAQREAGEVASGIKETLEFLFPVSSKYLLEME